MLGANRNNYEVIFNQSNINNFNRNKLYKEKLPLLDFNFINIEIDKLNLINEELNNSKIQKENLLLLSPANTEFSFSQFNLTQSDMNEIYKIANFEENANNNTNGSFSLTDIEEIKNTFKDNLFNIYGRMKQRFKNKISNEEYSLETFNNRFDLTLEIENISNNTYNYTVKLLSVKDSIVGFLNNEWERSNICITNLRAELLKDNEGFYSIVLYGRLETKIYLDRNSTGTNANANVMKNNIINNKETVESFRHDVQKFIGNSNTNKFKNRKSMANPIVDYKKLVDLTSGNETSFVNNLDLTQINEFINKFSNNLKDFESLQSKEVERSIYGFTYSNENESKKNSNSLVDKVVGVVTEYIRTDKGYDNIKFESLIDSNYFQIFLFANRNSLDVRENSIVEIRRGTLKIDKNLNIVLTNINQNNIRTLALLSNECAAKFKKFRYNKNRPFNCFFNLLQNVCVRHLDKYLVVLKKITKIQIVKQHNIKIFEKFPNLKITVSCIVDDGTLESFLYLENYVAFNLLKLTTEHLTVYYTF